MRRHYQFAQTRDSRGKCVLLEHILMKKKRFLMSVVLGFLITPFKAREKEQCKVSTVYNKIITSLLLL